MTPQPNLTLSPPLLALDTTTQGNLIQIIDPRLDRLICSSIIHNPPALQKYMKNPQSSQPVSSSISEERPPRAQPPAQAPVAPSGGSLASGSGGPVQQTGDQSYQGSTSGLLDKQSGFYGGNPATGQQAPATTNVHVQSPPTIEYEDDEPPQAAPQFSAHNASSSTPPSAGRV